MTKEPFNFACDFNESEVLKLFESIGKVKDPVEAELEYLRKEAKKEELYQEWKEKDKSCICEERNLKRFDDIKLAFSEARYTLGRLIRLLEEEE